MWQSNHRPEGSLSYEVDIPKNQVYTTSKWDIKLLKDTEIEFALLIDNVCPYTTASVIAKKMGRSNR